MFSGKHYEARVGTGPQIRVVRRVIENRLTEQVGFFTAYKWSKNSQTYETFKYVYHKKRKKVGTESPGKLLTSPFVNNVAVTFHLNTQGGARSNNGLFNFQT